MRLSACGLAAMMILLGIARIPAISQENAAAFDIHGEPLPARAIARLGPSRMHAHGQVNSLVYSPDGKWLAAAGAGDGIRIWDAATGKTLFTFSGHRSSICSVAFISDGQGSPKMLVSGSDDKTIRFWDLKTGKELDRTIKTHGDVKAVAVSPDGMLLASGGAESHLYLWRIADGKEIRRWRAHAGGISALAFGPDGKTIASGADHGDQKNNYGVAVWDVDTGKPRHTFAGHTTVVWAIALSADGTLLASTGVDDATGRSILLWDTRTGKQVRTVGTRFTDAKRLAMTADGKMLAAPDFHNIAVWDTGTGDPRPSFYPIPVTPFSAPTPAQNAVALAFSPEGKTLACADQSGQIRLFNVAGRTVKLIDQGHTQAITSVAVSPDGRTIVTTAADGVYFWDRATSKPLRQLKQKALGGGGASCSSFAPDSRTIALTHGGGITLWNVGTGAFKRRIMSEVRDSHVSATFSPDGRWLASESGSLRPHATLWDVRTGEAVRTFTRAGDRFSARGNSVAISPDSRLLASAAANGLNVWELNSGKAVFQKNGGVNALAFSPGGFLLASAGPDVKVLDAIDGAELASFEARLIHHPWRGLAFSVDGRLIAVADMNHVKLWDVMRGRELPPFEGHQGMVTSVAFTPDGKSLVSSATDGNALIWDLTGVLPALQAVDPNADWEDLKHSDRLRAYAAYCRLRANDKASAMLEKNMKPALAVPSDRVADLIKKLDSSSFAVRGQAYQELQKLGSATEAALMQARKSGRSLETNRRLEMLIADLQSGVDWRRTIMGISLLEESKTGHARALLQNLSKGDPDSRLTQAAREALLRVRRHDKEQKE